MTPSPTPEKLDHHVVCVGHLCAEWHDRDLGPILGEVEELRGLLGDFVSVAYRWRDHQQIGPSDKLVKAAEAALRASSRPSDARPTASPPDSMSSAGQAVVPANEGGVRAHRTASSPPPSTAPKAEDTPRHKIPRVAKGAKPPLREKGAPGGVGGR